MKLKVAFVCVHNSCRSQIAEGWAKYLAPDLMKAYSAGTERYPEIKPKAIEVMKEIDIDINAQYPKLLSEISKKVDILITMGCNVNCPTFPSRHRADWNLDDPSGKSIHEFRITRDKIKLRILDLIAQIESGEFS